ncbi:cell division protein FtsB [Cyclonatronum proteinivorum]|uniref:Cell division protein FtsB n=1 Tax=Cyclonatronum proteinivorum TaxID=1457365 RepID=A0A345UHU7_9BACT|nr:septum formation initiator family protein [Cyclonatronum proteinivorum]AXJ00049.1 cell division protein FtsB [Cyclonatronum proteinivorum]
MKPVFNSQYWNFRYLTLLFIGFLLIWFSFFDDHSLLTRYQLHKQHSDLRQQIEQLQEETRKVEQQIQALETDPARFERLAREAYGMRRPGEVIYEFRSKP